MDYGLAVRNWLPKAHILESRSWRDSPALLHRRDSERAAEIAVAFVRSCYTAPRYKADSLRHCRRLCLVDSMVGQLLSNPNRLCDKNLEVLFPTSVVRYRNTDCIIAI